MVPLHFARRLTWLKAQRDFSLRNRIYNRYFTKSLIAHALKRKLDDGVSKAELAKIKSVRDYDDKITCHIAGYEDADAYYEGSSPLPHLSKITTPTMLVHSDNNPLIPVDAYQKINRHNSLFCVITRGGGHVGFHSRRQAYDCWQTEMAMQFFEWRVSDIKLIKRTDVRYQITSNESRRARRICH